MGFGVENHILNSLVLFSHKGDYGMSKWKITKLTVLLLRENRRPGEVSSICQVYEDTNITPALLDDISTQLLQGKIKRIEIDNETEQIGMSIFVDGQKSQIGIVDEWNGLIYYYSSGNHSQRTVDICGSSFEEWMICNQPKTMLSILRKFIESGEKLNTALWVSEEI